MAGRFALGGMEEEEEDNTVADLWQQQGFNPGLLNARAGERQQRFTATSFGAKNPLLDLPAMPSPAIARESVRSQALQRRQSGFGAAPYSDLGAASPAANDSSASWQASGHGGTASPAPYTALADRLSALDQSTASVLTRMDDYMQQSQLGRSVFDVAAEAEGDRMVVPLLDYSGVATPIKLRLNGFEDSGMDYGADDGANDGPSQGVTESPGLFGAQPERYTEFDANDDEDVDLTAAFCEVLRESSSAQTAFQAAGVLFDRVEQKAKAIASKLLVYSSHRSRSDSMLSALKVLRLEKATWRLITDVYYERYTSERNAPFMTAGPAAAPESSDRSKIEYFFNSDPEMRHSQRVVEWLEETGLWQYEELHSDKNYETDSVSNLNTLHRLKRKRQAGGRHDPTGLPSETTMVALMDPDAPARTGKRVIDADAEDEDRLLKKLFTLARTGQLAEAHSLCRACGQAWRAASLEGWRLWHDRNADIKDEPSMGLQDVEGNWHREVWKSTCLQLSQDERFGLYERALYAVNSGNLQALTRVCSTWEDALWAHFKVMVDVRIEAELRKHPHPQRGTVIELPEWYFLQRLSPETIFAELSGSRVKGIRAGAQNPFRVIQQCIIVGDIPTLVQHMHSLIRITAAGAPDETGEVGGERPPPALDVIPYLRCFAHLVLFFRHAGVPDLPEAMCNDVMQAYVQDLIDQRRTEEVAVYTAQLPPEVQLSMYTAFLRDIEDKKLQKRCLQLAAEAGLDVSAITKNVVEELQTTKAAAAPGQDFVPAGDIDKKKIDAIDWLVIDRSQRAEALIQSNAIIRQFLGVGKIEAATQIFAKVPGDSLAVVQQEWSRRAGAEPLPAQVENAIKEHLSIQAYLDAQSAFNSWFHHRNNMRPAPPSPLRAGTVSYSEEVAYEMAVKRFENERIRWQKTADLHMEAASQKLYNVLMFPSGWMVDTAEGPSEVQDAAESSARASRRAQIDVLRRRCLIETCTCLYRVLHETEQYKQSLKLADIIASEKYGLCDAFAEEPEELRKFLVLLRSSALALLEDHADPLGYL